MKAIIISSTVACAVVSYLPSLPSLKVVVIASSGFMLGLVIVWGWVFTRAPQVLSKVNGLFAVAFGAVLGTGLAVYLCQTTLQGQLPDSLSGQPTQVTGWVTGVPQHHSDDQTTRWQFDFRVANFTEHPNLSVNKLRLTWREPEPGLQGSSFEMAQMLAPGQGLRLSLKLYRPRGSVNPAGFDYQQWLLSNGYGATGYVTEGSLWVVEPNLWRDRVAVGFDKARARIKSTVEAFVINQPAAASILALVIGDKSGLDDQQWQLLQLSGTVHLLVVSGLHISLIAGAGWLLGMLCSRLMSLFTLQLLRWIPASLSMVLAIGYAGLAGFSLPTQRALVMALVANIFWCFGWHKNPWLGYWLAALLVLIIDPLAAHSAGFWLSFSVVAVILLSLAHRTHERSWWAVTKLQLLIFVGMLVPLAATTGSVSVAAPLVNLIAIPFVSFTVVPVSLLAGFLALFSEAVVLTEWLLWLASFLLQLFWDGLALLVGLEKVTGSGWLQFLLPVYFIDLWQWLLLLVASAFVLLPYAGLWLRVAMALAVAAFAVSPPSNDHKPSAELIVLDVGQGLSAVVRLGERILVYDTGPPLGARLTTAEASLIPLLQSMGISAIDLLVVSHGDADHATGLAALTEQFPIKQIISGEPERLSIGAEPCRAGEQWRWGAASLATLWPKIGRAHV